MITPHAPVPSFRSSSVQLSSSPAEVTETILLFASAATWYIARSSSSKFSRVSSGSLSSSSAFASCGCSSGSSSFGMVISSSAFSCSSTHGWNTQKLILANAPNRIPAAASPAALCMSFFRFRGFSLITSCKKENFSGPSLFSIDMTYLLFHPLYSIP